MGEVYIPMFTQKESEFQITSNFEDRDIKWQSH